MSGVPSDDEMQRARAEQQVAEAERRARQAAQLALDILNDKPAGPTLDALGVLPAMQLTSRQLLLSDLIHLVARQAVAADSVADLKLSLWQRARGEAPPTAAQI